MLMGERSEKSARLSISWKARPYIPLSVQKCQSISTTRILKGHIVAFDGVVLARDESTGARGGLSARSGCTHKRYRVKPPYQRISRPRSEMRQKKESPACQLSTRRTQGVALLMLTGLSTRLPCHHSTALPRYVHSSKPHSRPLFRVRPVTWDLCIGGAHMREHPWLW
jgi:hypothetical protein